MSEQNNQQSYPLISVIIPVYNAEKTVQCCLDSVLAQTYSSFEVIIVDDGSRDESLAICNRYAAVNSCIKVVSQQNGGPSAARNTGIDIASGQYLSFVDSDDYVEPDMLERMSVAAMKNDADMVICNYWDEKDGKKNPHIFSQAGGVYNEAECQEIARKIISDNTKTRIPPYSCIRLVRRSVLDDAHLRFATNVKRSEDYLLWTQVHFQIKRLVLLSDAYLYHYVSTTTSITNSYLPGYWSMCKSLFAELNENLPDSVFVKKRLKSMLIQRALIALHNAAEGTQKQFDADCQTILSDRELLRATWQVGFFSNSMRAKVFSAMLVLGMKNRIKKEFQK